MLLVIYLLILASVDDIGGGNALMLFKQFQYKRKSLYVLLNKLILLLCKQHNTNYGNPLAQINLKCYITVQLNSYILSLWW